VVRLVVRDIVGDPHCTYPPDGDAVRERIADALAAAPPVEVSFAGVERLTSGFLNVAVFQLYGEHKPDDWPRLDEAIRPVGLIDDHAAMWRGALARAKQYFTDPERVAQMQREAAGMESEPEAA